MTDPTTVLALAGAALAGLGMASAALLRGWRDWLDVRRLEIAGRHGDPGAPSPTSRRPLPTASEAISRALRAASITVVPRAR